ncbi:MAG TPA: DUF87 domain-containing protein [Euryarchaeota archaeon]|nr:DUF87 domain-containing protein [Euryarchaeota archaeon]
MGGRFGRYGNIVCIDIFGSNKRKTTYSCLIQGKQGTGKSTFTKKLLLQYNRKDINSFVIDPHGEWKHISELHGYGAHVIGQESLNVLDLDGIPLPLKISLLAEIFQEILGDDPSRAQYVAIRQSLKRTYAKFGLKIDQPKTWNKQCPTLKDVYNDIKEQIPRLKGVKRVTHEVILEAMEDFAVGIFSKSLVKNTLKIDWNQPLNVFDISKADPTVRKLVTLTLMGKIYQKTKANLKPNILLIDEGWRMLENPHVARYVGEFMKEGRKTNTSLILVIHHLGDLHKISPDIADELKRGMGWHAIFHLDESARKQTAKEFGLTETQTEFIKDAETGELLLITDTQPQFCKVILTGSKKEFDINTEYWQFTTRPEEVELRNQKLGKTKIKLKKEPTPQKEPESPNYQNLEDLKKLIIPTKSLSEEKKKDLETQRYKVVRVHKIAGYGTETYYVHRSIKNQSHDTGVYQLASLIQQDLKTSSNQIKIRYNHGADIEFPFQERQIHIEYANSKASTSDLAKKMDLEKEVSPQNYIVIISTETLRKRYQGFKNVYTRKEFWEEIKA